MTNKGKLFLIPTAIADDTAQQVIPAGVLDVLPGVRFFLAENIRTARRFLSSLKIYPSIEALHFSTLDKDTPITEIPGMLQPLEAGENVGILSESGCPGVADPGALAVAAAHTQGFQVVPLVGPSSIVLSLMASGLNGQCFAFQGYLPIDRHEASRAIKEFENESRVKHQTQIFIETPYRNNQILELLSKTLQPGTQLTAAIDVTGKSEFIKTVSVGHWRKMSVTLPRMPAVFLFLANS